MNKYLATVVFSLVLCGCSIAPPSFREKTEARYFESANFPKNYQELYRCFVNSAPMPFVDGGDKYWQERIYADLGLAEYQVGTAQIRYTLIEFKKVSLDSTQVSIWSQYGHDKRTGHLGLYFFSYIGKCVEN